MGFSNAGCPKTGTQLFGVPLIPDARADEERVGRVEPGLVGEVILHGAAGHPATLELP